MNNRNNREGGFYAAKVRLFLNEYGGENLEEFCEAEKVSYKKMCNCLGRPSYRKSSVKQPTKPSFPSLDDSQVVAEIKPLVIDRQYEKSQHPQSLQSVTDTLSNVTVRLRHTELHIASCSAHTMVSFLKEMEAALC